MAKVYSPEHMVDLVRDMKPGTVFVTIDATGDWAIWTRGPRLEMSTIDWSVNGCEIRDELVEDDGIWPDICRIVTYHTLKPDDWQVILMAARHLSEGTVRATVLERLMTELGYDGFPT